MGYLWFVEKLKKSCFWFRTYQKRFIILYPELLNSIPGHSSLFSVSLFSQSCLWKLTTYKCHRCSLNLRQIFFTWSWTLVVLLLLVSLCQTKKYNILFMSNKEIQHSDEIQLLLGMETTLKFTATNLFLIKQHGHSIILF